MLVIVCGVSFLNQPSEKTIHNRSRNNLGMKLELHKLQFLLTCMMNLQNKRKQQILHPKNTDTP